MLYSIIHFFATLATSTSVVFSIALWLKGTVLPGCGPKSGCDAVRSSRWAWVGPIPVSAIGAVFYFFLTGVFIAAAFVPGSRQFLFLPISAGAVAAIGAAVWFTALQAAVIRRFCTYCMIVHAAGSIAGVAVLVDVEYISLSAIAIGVIASASLIATQILWRRKLFELIPADSPNAAANSAAQNAATNSHAKNGDIKLFNGGVNLSIADWPLLGNRAAKNTIALLYDITCPDCRDAYKTLAGAARNADSSLVVLAVPVPMHPDCNHTIHKDGNHDHDTCDHVRLALAIWNIDPALYREYKTWLFAYSKLPSLMEVRSHANRAIGTAKLTVALSDPRIESRLRQAVAIFAALPREQLPQILLPHAIIRGKVTADELLAAISSNPSPAATSK